MSALTVLWLSPQNSCSQDSALLLNPNYCRVLKQTTSPKQNSWPEFGGQRDRVGRYKSTAKPLRFYRTVKSVSKFGFSPLVTLDPTTTQLANQVKGLSVFPCLATRSPDDGETSGTGLVASALWQVIQVAAGMSWKPSILLADISTLPDLHRTAGGNPTEELENRDESTKAEIPMPNSQFSNPNFSALIQYIQTAGFRGWIAPCWTEVLQQLQYQSVDLILLCLPDAPSESTAMLHALSKLRQMAVKLPILVWDYRSLTIPNPRRSTFCCKKYRPKFCLLPYLPRNC